MARFGGNLDCLTHRSVDTTVQTSACQAFDRKSTTVFSLEGADTIHFFAFEVHTRVFEGAFWSENGMLQDLQLGATTTTTHPPPRVGIARAPVRSFSCP